MIGLGRMKLCDNSVCQRPSDSEDGADIIDVVILVTFQWKNTDDFSLLLNGSNRSPDGEVDIPLIHFRHPVWEADP